MNGLYTHSVNYLKRVDQHGWMFQSFKTTSDALPSHLRSLSKQAANGTVRNIETIKLK